MALQSSSCHKRWWLVRIGPSFIRPVVIELTTPRDRSCTCVARLAVTTVFMCDAQQVISSVPLVVGILEAQKLYWTPS